MRTALSDDSDCSQLTSCLPAGIETVAVVGDAVARSVPESAQLQSVQALPSVLVNSKSKPTRVSG